MLKCYLQSIPQFIVLIKMLPMLSKGDDPCFPLAALLWVIKFSNYPIWFLELIHLIWLTQCYSGFMYVQVYRWFYFIIETLALSNPRQQPLAHSPASRIRKRIERVKDRKARSLHKDRLMGKAKPMHKSKAKQGINSLISTTRLAFSHLHERRGASNLMVTWEN